MSQPHDIDYLLDEVITLPSLPDTIAKLTELVNDPNVSLAAIGKVMSADPSLALKSLRLVNSAFYGLREKVTSVEHAVVLLGGKVVKNLVCTAAVFDTIQTGEATLLRHSVACGVAMRALTDSGTAEAAAPTNRDEAFIFGLLHDVGKLILEQFMKDEYAMVRSICASRGIPINAAEQEVLGVDHGELGARLAVKWRLSEELADAVRGHHDPGRCETDVNRPKAALLCVADYLCHAAGFGVAGHPAPLVPEQVWALSGISSAAVPRIAESFFGSVHDIDELMEVA